MPAPPLPCDQARIDEEASAWIVRLSERPLAEHEARELERWRGADPRHEQAFASMQRTWDKIPELGNLADLVPPELAQTPPLMRQRFARQIRYLVGGVTAAAAAILAILFVPGIWETAGARYTTDIAQTRLVALPDGSQVTLGPDSSLDVAFTSGERWVHLSGEAFFEVTHNAARPFFVDTGSALVRVVGTKFDVNQTADSVRVSVLEGVVQVMPPTPKSAQGPRATETLRAGERVEVAWGTSHPRAASIAPSATPQPMEPTVAPGSWREGRLSYDNARLGDVIADINRYYAPKATMNDRQLNNLRITASFKASEIPAFLSSLDQVVPVRTEEASNGAFHIESRNP